MFLVQFDNLDEEIEYRKAERNARASIIRVLTLIAFGIVFTYLLVNPLFIGTPTVGMFTVVSIPTMIILFIYAVVTRSQHYETCPALDFLFFVALGICVGVLAAIIARESKFTHWEPHVILAENSMILLAFSCFSFAASHKWFLIWCGSVTAAFCILLIWAIEAPGIAKIYASVNYLTVLFIVVFAHSHIDERSRTVFGLRRSLIFEKKKTEDLLYNVLPQQVAERLRAGMTVADAFIDTSVIFVDVVGFSNIAKTLSAGHLVELLNRFFSIADEAAEIHGVEKIKTVGDAYLAIAGAMVPCENSGVQAIAFARRVIDNVRQLECDTNIDFKVRIGIHIGPVIGGVIGSKRIAYDYWGDTMNVASRLQEAAKPNGITVSEAAYFRTKNVQEYKSSRSIILKGIGERPVYDAILDLGTAVDPT